MYLCTYYFVKSYLGNLPYLIAFVLPNFHRYFDDAAYYY